MKKTIITILTLILATPFGFVRAESIAQVQLAPSRQNIIRERLEKQRVNYLQNLQEARDITREYRDAKTPEERNALQVQTQRGFIIRLSAAIQKISDMQMAVERRIEWAGTKGMDVSIPKAHLVRSQTYLETVLDEQENLKTLLESKETQNAEDIRERARAIFDSMKSNIELSRESLHLSIESLKEIMKTTKESEIKTTRPIENTTITR